MVTRANLTNEAGLPDAIVEAVLNDSYSPGEKSDISVTQLISPPQIRMLKKQHNGEIVEDVSDRIYALIGQAVHTILERAEQSAVVEKRLYAKFLGWTVSGQFDRLHVRDGVLQDYKIASIWEYIYGLKDDRIKQLNILAELCERNGYAINKLEIVMIFRDWKKSEAKYKSADEYPKHQVAIIDVPLMSKHDRDFLITGLVRDHQVAEQGLIRPCTKDERWAKDDSYAVMKRGRKSAMRVLPTEEDAKAWMEENGGDSIEFRKGVSTRCEDYCDVAPFCQQYKAMKGE